MAGSHTGAALRAPAHRLAEAGHGKRHAPDEAPRGAADFVHLPAREAAIAAYIDRLPEGAAIGYKVLAEELPGHGQQACHSALDRLTGAGRLRRVKVPSPPCRHPPVTPPIARPRGRGRRSGGGGQGQEQGRARGAACAWRGPPKSGP
ncbi:hypothetical protein ACIQZB_15965 [Streptomyces sp. NPDC097727]|uniref:hypothetical protein n=1 Tax=Streptomyces sp. NPDC097727 TaxID=3366092 RepID=UPI0037F669CF